VHTDTTIVSQQYEEGTGCWTIQTEPPVQSLPHFDHVYFATGAHIDVKQLDMLQTMNQRYPIESYGGIPALTDDLMWQEDVPLFVTGKLATLQIGPGAANLEGARLCAERVAWGVEEVLQRSNDGVESVQDLQGVNESWTAGIGSKFARLPEE